jgi:hypothetical protein
MKIAIYTSFAVNYLAKARVLVQSVKQHNPGIDVIAIVCDRFPLGIDIAGEQFDQIWTVEDYPAVPLRSWIFSHNIMELATAVKGWGLIRLLDAGYDYVLYLDADCWVLADPAEIVALLPPEISVGVVPHTMRPADSDEEIRIVETSSLRHGIYNLGFLLVRNDDNGKRLARWWSARLDRYCIDDFNRGLFTDQRWFDLALGYFDFIKILRHKGIDVASWNIGQRTLSRDGDNYRIGEDRLIFYHFSGVGPAGVHRWVRDKFAPADPLAAELEFRYEALINACGQKDLEKVIPSFDLYSDGHKVPSAHRALYRSSPDLMYRFQDPYDVSAAPNFREVAAGDAGAPAAGATEAAVRADLGKLDALARRLFDAEFFVQQGAGEVLTETDVEGLWALYGKSAWCPEISGNRFFDPRYYALFVPEGDRQKYRTPLHHYLAEGAGAGLSPCWAYDDAYYLDRYPDVREMIREGSIVCGFEHFSRVGAEDGRDGCGFFNERAYRARHPDIEAAIAAGRLRSGEAHYAMQGHREKRPLR